MLFSKGINFQDYLSDYLFWQNEHFKSKKVFKNILSVLYGRKKDRGHIKERYIKSIEEQKRSMAIRKKTIKERLPETLRFRIDYMKYYTYFNKNFIQEVKYNENV